MQISEQRVEKIKIHPRLLHRRNGLHNHLRVHVGIGLVPNATQTADGGQGADVGRFRGVEGSGK